MVHVDIHCFGKSNNKHAIQTCTTIQVIIVIRTINGQPRFSQQVYETTSIAVNAEDKQT